MVSFLNYIKQKFINKEVRIVSNNGMEDIEGTLIKVYDDSILVGNRLIYVNNIVFIENYVE